MILWTQAGAHLLEVVIVHLPDMAIACTLQFASRQLPNGTILKWDRGRYPMRRGR
jgi:hypothetical protein